jgi:hypothetical protein
MEKEKKIDLAVAMPRTAAWIKQQREQFGNQWVTHCVRLGMAGEPGHFYAMENGHVAGTPFNGARGVPMDDLHQFALFMGCKSAVFMATPAKEAAKLQAAA